jgi:hypothetical protein
MRIKRRIILLILLQFALIIMSNCTSELECEPVVVMTSNNYTAEEHLLPFEDIHGEFAEYYATKDLSVDLRQRIIQKMQDIAEELGEEPAVLYQCIKITYEDWLARPMRIPCYAEKCQFEEQSVWAIAFNRVNSFDESNPVHFDIFFVSCSTYTILFSDGCFR